MIKTKRKSNIFDKLFFLLMLSLGFGIFMIDTFFSIKPYMFVLILIFLILMLTKKRKIENIKFYEIMYVFYIAFCCITVFFAENVFQSLRYILGMIIMLVCYFGTRELLNNISKNKVINIINNVNIILAIVTLIYYGYGILSLGFNFSGNGVIRYGVMLDRSIPRLISFASSDPNITCFIFTLFLFFNLFNIREKKCKLGFILTLLIIILTFSRGAYVAFVVTFIFYFLLKNKFSIQKMLPKIIKIGILAIFGMLLLNWITNGFVRDMIQTRMIDSSDGGSGRVMLWKNALTLFKSSPVLGIGLNNLYLDLGNVYVHNTLLQVLVETGLLGFLIYIIFILGVCYHSYKLYKYDSDNSIFLCITICMIIQMFFLSILIQEAFFIYLAIFHRFLIKDDGKEKA